MYTCISWNLVWTYGISLRSSISHKKIMNQELNISRHFYVHMRKIDKLDLERVLF